VERTIAKIRKTLSYLKERGPLWTSLYVSHYLGVRALEEVERRIFALERRRFFTGENALTSQSNTISENNQKWSEYDWSAGGNEWTEAVRTLKGMDPAQWKGELVDGLLCKHIKKGATVLEIGPGAGRWTEILQPICGRLLLADISERCLQLCRERFGQCANVEYHLIKGGRLDFLAAEMLDNIWSYDVFVHINPTDTDRYLEDLAPALKRGAVGIIHHAGSYASEEERSGAFRSHLDGPFFAHLVQKHGMELLEQNATLTHKVGDLISVIRRPLA